jgi:LPS sulfotransferase NodH
MVGDQRRYFILSAGRSGSTLLAAILADAGGDFGMRVRRLNLASAK